MNDEKLPYLLKLTKRKFLVCIENIGLCLNIRNFQALSSEHFPEQFLHILIGSIFEAENEEPKKYVRVVLAPLLGSIS